MIKKLMTLLAAMIVLTSQSVSAEEQAGANTAAILNKDAVYLIDGAATKVLSDEKIGTQHESDAPFVVDISSETEISYINVLFDKAPLPYTLVADGVTLKQGEYGFIHDLIALDTPSKKLVLTFPMDTVVGSLDIYSKGVLPPTIQQWNAPYADADMLILPTHADDDQLYFGGVIAKYAGDEQKKVQVAYFTNHFSEPYRQHELLNGLWSIGVTAYPIIPAEFTDIMSESLEHAKSLYDTQAMLEYQVSLIRRFKPEVIVGHDLNGEYGHGVHMLNANLLTQSIELSSVATVFPDSAALYGAFDVPKTYLHSYNENKIEIEVDTPLDSFGGKTAFEMAQLGFSMHKSQQTGAFKVEHEGPYDCRQFGLFRTIVGSDLTGIDMFENVENHSSVVSQPTTSQAQSSDVAATVSETPPVTPQKEPTFWENMRSYIYIIAGAAVIIFTMLTHNKRVASKISRHTIAYKNAPRNR